MKVSELSLLMVNEDQTLRQQLASLVNEPVQLSAACGAGTSNDSDGFKNI